METEEKTPKNQDINYLEIMRAQKFYNEVRIPGYNHLLGTMEGTTVPTKYDLPKPTIGDLK